MLSSARLLPLGCIEPSPFPALAIPLTVAHVGDPMRRIIALKAILRMRAAGEPGRASVEIIGRCGVTSLDIGTFWNIEQTRLLEPRSLIAPTQTRNLVGRRTQEDPIDRETTISSTTKQINTRELAGR